MLANVLFSGLGGTCLGLVQAGVSVLWAGNHCPVSVDTHARNHPNTQHLCQCHWLTNWLTLPKAPIMAASPSCKGNTQARGKEQEHHDAERETAWCVIQAVEAVKPDVVLIENVPGMMNGAWPLFPAWEYAWECLGYKLAKYVLDAADFGVPQNRVRLMMVATKSKHPLELTFEKQEHVPVADFIDWEGYKWSKIETRAKATRERWENGRAQYGDTFVMPYYGSGSGKTGRSIQRPLGTVTCHARWAVVRGSEVRMLRIGELKRIMGFPADYLLPSNVMDANRLIGNAVPPGLAKGFMESVLRAA